MERSWKARWLWMGNRGEKSAFVRSRRTRGDNMEERAENRQGRHRGKKVWGRGSLGNCRRFLRFMKEINVIPNCGGGGLISMAPGGSEKRVVLNEPAKKHMVVTNRVIN